MSDSTKPRRNYPAQRMSPGTPIVQRLLHYTNQNGPGGCWVWQGARSSSGYGRIQVDRKLRFTHRVSFETFVGPIPDGLVIDHLCRNRACLNPKHLEPVTPAENTIRSGNATKTHCPQGHPYGGANLLQLEGHRRCRECSRRNWRNWYARYSEPPISHI